MAVLFRLLKRGITFVIEQRHLRWVVDADNWQSKSLTSWYTNIIDFLNTGKGVTQVSLCIHLSVEYALCFSF